MDMYEFLDSGSFGVKPGNKELEELRQQNTELKAQLENSL
jgi:hypothetical protein